VSSSEDFIQSLAKAMLPGQLEKLLKAYGGSTFYLPKLGNLNRVARNAEIRAEWAEGANYLTLAIRYGVTTRQIRRIVDGPKKARGGPKSQSETLVNTASALAPSALVAQVPGVAPAAPVAPAKAKKDAA
jgi:hypothetical protein